MAWILPLILVLATQASAYSHEAAVTAYRALQKHVAEVRRSLPQNPDPGASFLSLNLERDSIDARYPFHPKEPAALTAERRRADLELRALTSKASNPTRSTAGKKQRSPKKKSLKRE